MILFLLNHARYYQHFQKFVFHIKMQTLNQNSALVVSSKEMNQKENIKKRLRKEIRSISIQLKQRLTLLTYSVLLKKILTVIRSKQMAVTMPHKRNLINLRQYNYKENTNTQFLKNVVNNFLPYSLLENEIKV